MPHEFSPQRYDKMKYRRSGRSGLQLPPISLGAWETFGGYRGEETARECIFRAFDLGIIHFDLANNYGKPPGNAELVCGRIFKEMPRDELVISTKAGFLMWPGPYGEWGSRKYIIASLNQSLKRLGVDYVDIFYSHRPDPETPLEETIGTLNDIVKSGKAIYAGVSNYNGEMFSRVSEIVKRERWSPIVIHQPCYNLINRWPEKDLFPHTRREGTGVIAFCPLAQGLLTDKYLNGIPPDSRAALWWDENRRKGALTDKLLEKLRALNKLAQQRGQSLAQMALAWILRNDSVTSALIGASKVSQIEENVKALDNAKFSDDELKQIDALTQQ
jgi:L-glyceraldehyde 3-phosphate reductase